MRKPASVVLLIMVTAQTAFGLTVEVLGRDTPVTLDSVHFVKYELRGGKAIKTVYYDATNQYVVYRERSLYQHRCEVPSDVIDEWVGGEYPDRYFDRKIDDKYGCDSANTPSY